MPMPRHIVKTVTLLILLRTAPGRAAGLDISFVEPQAGQADIWMLFGLVGLIAGLAVVQVMTNRK
jgi:hypothetical protein